MSIKWVWVAYEDDVRYRGVQMLTNYKSKEKLRKLYVLIETKN